MSLFAGVRDFYEGIPFRNVEGSERDFCISNKSWLELWKEAVGYTSNHPPSCFGCGRRCGSAKGECVGGHIVLGENIDPYAASRHSAFLEDTNRVFIVPLCNGCNGIHNDHVFYARSVNPQGDGMRAVQLCLYKRDGRFNDAAFEDDFIKKYPSYNIYSQGYRKIVGRAAWKFYSDLENERIRNSYMNSYDAYLIRQYQLANQKRWAQTMPIQSATPGNAQVTTQMLTNSMVLRSGNVVNYYNRNDIQTIKR